VAGEEVGGSGACGLSKPELGDAGVLAVLLFFVCQRHWCEDLKGSAGQRLKGAKTPIDENERCGTRNRSEEIPCFEIRDHKWGGRAEATEMNGRYISGSKKRMWEEK
jgi:hypothetical protein